MPIDSVKIKSYSNYVLPYYMEMVQGAYEVQTNDVAYFGDIGSEYEVSYYNFNYTELLESQDMFGVNLGEYSAAEKLYEAFVRSQYLSVPKGTYAFLEEIIQEQGFDASNLQVLYDVAKYIQTAAAYDLKYPTSLDTESDVVISFLRDYKTGVCRHYAAAATMMFRALGLPARYVTGFMINAKANQWTQEKVGHAWVEV